MSFPITTDKPAAEATAANRRRHQRQMLCVPATIRTGESVIEGFTDNLSYSGLLVQSLTGIPTVGQECQVDLYLPMGQVAARGKIVRVDRSSGRFAVDLEHLDKNGELLLVAMLVGADDSMQHAAA
jgi:hypothetical protein